MSQQIRLKSGLVIIEKSNIAFGAGLLVGQINRWATITGDEACSAIRRIVDWVEIDELTHLSGFDSLGIVQLINSLEAMSFLERRNTESLTVKFSISHFNEVGAQLSALLMQNGIHVSLLDERDAKFSDVRSSYIRISDVGRLLSELLEAQRRELINSGNVEEPYSLNRKDSAQPDRSSPRRIVIITTYPEPELLARLMEEGTEYICALTTPFGAEIGPLVAPGTTPCFHCIELHRSERDEDWQKVATTLFLTRHDKIPLDRAYFTSAKVGALLLQIARGEIPHELFPKTNGFTATKSHSALASAENERASDSWSFHPDCSCHWGRALSTRAD